MSAEEYLFKLKGIPAEVIIDEDDLLPLEAAAGARPERPTPAQWMAMTEWGSLTDTHGTLAALGDLALMLGPRLRAQVRSDQRGRFRRVADMLRAWAGGDELVWSRGSLQEPGKQTRGAW